MFTGFVLVILTAVVVVGILASIEDAGTSPNLHADSDEL